MAGVINELRVSLKDEADGLLDNAKLPKDSMARRLLAADKVAVAVCHWADGRLPHKELVAALDDWRVLSGY